MSVLVTGAAGFLGSTVVGQLLTTGAPEIRCFVRPTSDVNRLTQLGQTRRGAALRLIQGNLTSATDVRRALSGVHTVYHLAAGMRGLAPADLFSNTVVASHRLLDGIISQGIRRVVLVSSLSVYGLAGVSSRRLIDEGTPLEDRPERRDIYAYAKLRQEQLFHQSATGFELVVLRPGPLYGPLGPEFPSRIGLVVSGLVFQLGRNRALPLSYVENCAHAMVLAGTSASFEPGAYNVVDDNLPTSSEYLRRYKREVARVRSIRIPFAPTMLLSAAAEQLHLRSKGQLPRVLTPYRTLNMWSGHRFDNRKLRRAGWSQIVSTEDALGRTFSALRRRRAPATHSASHPATGVLSARFPVVEVLATPRPSTPART